MTPLQKNYFFEILKFYTENVIEEEGNFLNIVATGRGPIFVL